jgi:hypothetical protein
MMHIGTFNESVQNKCKLDSSYDVMVNIGTSGWRLSEEGEEGEGGRSGASFMYSDSLPSPGCGSWMGVMVGVVTDGAGGG